MENPLNTEKIVSGEKFSVNREKELKEINKRIDNKVQAPCL